MVVTCCRLKMLLVERRVQPRAEALELLEPSIECACVVHAVVDFLDEPVPGLEVAVLLYLSGDGARPRRCQTTW